MDTLTVQAEIYAVQYNNTTNYSLKMMNRQLWGQKNVSTSKVAFIPQLLYLIALCQVFLVFCLPPVVLFT